MFPEGGESLRAGGKPFWGTLSPTVVYLDWLTDWVVANEERLRQAAISHKVNGPNNLQYKPSILAEFTKGKRTVEAFFWHTGEFEAQLFDDDDADPGYYVFVLRLEAYAEFEEQMERCFRFMSGPIRDEYGPRNFWK